MIVNMGFKYFSILLLVNFVYADFEQTPVDVCNAGGPLPLFVKIQGCETPPCLLAQGSDAVLDIILKTARYSTTLSTKVQAFIGTFGVSYDLGDQENACPNILNGYCPVAASEVLRYRLTMPILPIFPPIPVTLEFRIEDATEDILFCFRVAIRVTFPVEGRENNLKLE